MIKIYHVGPASQLIPSGRVPYKSDSKLHQFQQHQLSNNRRYHEITNIMNIMNIMANNLVVISSEGSELKWRKFVKAGLPLNERILGPK